MGVIKDAHIFVIEEAEKNNGVLTWFDAEPDQIYYSVFADSLLMNKETRDMNLEGEIVFRSSVDDNCYTFSRKKFCGKYKCVLARLKFDRECEVF